MTDFTTYEAAEDAVLGSLKVVWDASTPAITGGTAPALVYEFIESDLKPHPRDSGKPWARAVVRHADTAKASLSNADKQARYRRIGLVWVQVFVPAKYGSAWTVASQLAQVAQSAYEGKRALNQRVVFLKVTITDVARDGAWVRKDVKATFYWDEVK